MVPALHTAKAYAVDLAAQKELFDTEGQS